MHFETEFQKQIFNSKYLLENEKTPEEAINRLAKDVAKIYPEIEKDTIKYINKLWFIPGGSIWRAAGNPNKNISYFNCTTLFPVEDNLESIFDSLYKWSKFAAFGQGEGIDISNLRPKGSKVHNSSRTSTGSVSFMQLYDSVLKVIAQQGRRGATLISIHDNHPDIEDFITIKNKDNGKIESANISIQISNAFMNAVENNKEWTLYYKNKYEIIEKKVNAIDLFDKICKNAWECGDPGLQFKDTAKKYSNSDIFNYPICSTNACGEQFLDGENICALSHINLAKFEEFGWEIFKDLVHFGIKFINAIRLREYQDNRSPTAAQRKKIIEMPRSGLGITGLADYFIDNDIIYGSEESVKETKKIFQFLCKESYIEGYNLAKKYGSFKKYNKEKFKKSNFVKRLLEEKIIEEKILNYQFNVCYNTIAPVGTGSIIANCGGSGIEPLFSKYMVRRERATKNGEWKEWFIFNACVEKHLKKMSLDINRENADKLSDKKWIMSYDLDPFDKLNVVAEIQKYIDSSISNTFNLSENTTVEDIKKIYIEAWKKELKGVTVYRENTKTGVLITEKNYNKIKNKVDLQYSNIERPKDLPCDIYETSYKNHKFVVLVGLKDNKPFEIFVTTNNDNSIDVEKHKKGIIEKIRSSCYELKVENGVQKVVIKNIGKTFDSVYSSLSRLVSISLRYNIPIPKILDQLNEESQFQDFEKVITRILKKYIDNNTLSNKKCPECGSNLVYIEGCISCSDKECGYSRCE